MDAFFGGQAGTAGRGPRSRTTRGQDALVRLDIDLGDAVFGAQKDLTIDTAVACSTCHGGGQPAGHLDAHLRRLRAAVARSSRCSAASSARS